MAEWPVGAMKESNVSGAKGPCSVLILRPLGEAGRASMERPVNLQELRRRVYPKGESRKDVAVLGSLYAHLQDGDSEGGLSRGQGQRWGAGARWS